MQADRAPVFAVLTFQWRRRRNNTPIDTRANSYSSSFIPRRVNATVIALCWVVFVAKGKLVKGKMSLERGHWSCRLMEVVHAVGS